MWHGVWRLLALAMALAPLAPASGSVPLVALWDFDEAEGKRTAIDRGPHGLDGTVGADVRTGLVDDGVVAYRFPKVAPNSPPVRPEHLVTVPDTPRLNPDGGVFTVTVRFRSTSSPANIVQKGQRDSAGGYWKVEQVDGLVRCAFVDGNLVGVSAASTRRTDDGRWHTVMCVRTPEDVTLHLDGARMARTPGTTAPIANTWPLTIGGKTDCDQAAIGCDYFSGDVDLVRIEKE
jgi:hypothetical protein